MPSSPPWGASALVVYQGSGDTSRARHRFRRATRMSSRSRGGTVAKRTHVRASSVEAFLERHSPGYQYGYVLGLLAMTFIVMAAGPPDDWARVATVLLQGLTLCAALLASRVSLRLFRLAALVALVSLLAAIGSVVIDNGRNPSGVFYLLNVLLVATVPWIIARALWKRQIID